MIHLKLSNTIENLFEFEIRLSNNVIIESDIKNIILKSISLIKKKLANDSDITFFLEILLENLDQLQTCFDYYPNEFEAINSTIKLDGIKQKFFDKIYPSLLKQYNTFKIKDISKFPVINLLEKYKNSNFEQEFEVYKQKIKGFTNVNEKFNLKTGDIIKFISGENQDMIYISKILGFDSDGEAYILWDCYWFPINLAKRFVSKEENKVEPIIDNLVFKFKEIEKEKFLEAKKEFDIYSKKIDNFDKKLPGKILQDYYRKLNLASKNMERACYGHFILKNIFRDLNILESKPLTTAIKGFNYFTNGYEFNPNDQSRIEFNGINNERFEKIIEKIEQSGFEIEHKSYPSKSMVGLTASIQIKKVYNFDSKNKSLNESEILSINNSGHLLNDSSHMGNDSDLSEREFTTEEREKLAQEGKALPDGSYPIVNKKDLVNAIHTYGLCKNHSKARHHIIKRANALGVKDLIPQKWINK